MYVEYKNTKISDNAVRAAKEKAFIVIKGIN